MSDVRLIKSSLRKDALNFRKSLSKDEKAEKDKVVFNKIISLDAYINADTVLCYYSTEYEVETHKIIDYSLKIGKKVALPRCLDNSGNMEFKYISSLDELSIGTFGIKEPGKQNESFIKSDNAICVIPSLMIDRKGYRIGYGKGYYDRFLNAFNGIKCAVCYKENIVDNLPFYDTDIKADVCITG